MMEPRDTNPESGYSSAFDALFMDPLSNDESEAPPSQPTSGAAVTPPDATVLGLRLPCTHQIRVVFYWAVPHVNTRPIAVA